MTAKRGTRLRHCSDAAIENAVRLATREMLSSGITTVADCSQRGISGRVLAQEPIRSYVFHEAHPETAEDENEIVVALSRRIGAAADRAATGIRPHAVYSLSPDAHAALAESDAETGNCGRAMSRRAQRSSRRFPIRPVTSISR